MFRLFRYIKRRIRAAVEGYAARLVLRYMMRRLA